MTTDVVANQPSAAKEFLTAGKNIVTVKDSPVKTKHALGWALIISVASCVILYVTMSQRHKKELLKTTRRERKAVTVVDVAPAPAVEVSHG